VSLSDIEIYVIDYFSSLQMAFFCRRGSNGDRCSLVDVNSS